VEIKVTNMEQPRDVLDQDVNCQSCVLDRPVHGSGSMGLCEIGLQHAAVDPVACLEVVRERREPIQIPRHEDQRDPEPGQLHSYRPTDPSRRARHQTVPHGLPFAFR
jgi:hypothetical protein